MLTVVLTTRDRATTLGRTLDAYERLDAPTGGYRLVVADDGSRDATPAVLHARAARLPLVVVEGPAVGQNGARNRALTAIEGDLVVFTDDDALPHAGWLAALRAAADAHPEADVIVGTVRPRFLVEPPAHVLRAVRPGPSFACVERPADGPVDPTEAVGPAVAIRADRFAAGLRFDATIGPDGSAHYAMGAETELLLRLRRDGARAWYARDAVTEHVVTAAQLEEPALLLRAYRYGRGRWRLRTSRLARARLRVRGLPLAILADLLARRVAYARATWRGDRARTLRAAWRLAYLAGHVDEVRRERGRVFGLGWLRRCVPAPLRAIFAGPPATPASARPWGGAAPPTPAVVERRS